MSMFVFPSLVAAKATGLLPGRFLNKTRPVTWGDSTPVEIPSYSDSELETVVLNQSVEAERRDALLDALIIDNSIDISNQVNEIMEKNSKMLGFSSEGVNAFDSVNLVYDKFNTQSSVPTELGDDISAEPNGFRLYLIKPSKPPVKQLASLTGGFVEKGGGLAEDGAKKLEEVTNIPLGEQGKKVNEFSKSISKTLQDSANAWDKKFDTYINKAYSGIGGSFYSAVLPIPKELTDSHTHEMDTLMMGIAPRMLAGLAVGLSGMGGGGGSPNANRKINANDALGSFLGAVGGSVSSLLGGVASAAGQYAFDTARARLGIGANPNTEMLYSKPVNRNFQFSFQLYPKSKKEVDNIYDFISRLKQHSYPLSIMELGQDNGNPGQGQVYSYPGEVYFEFSGKYRGKLFRSLRPCIIQTIQVNYADAGEFQNFRDGTPSHISIFLGMTETRLLDRNILFEEDKKEFRNNNFANKGFRDQIYGSGTFAGSAVKQFVEGNGNITDLFGRSAPSDNIPEYLRRQ